MIYLLSIEYFDYFFRPLLIYLLSIEYFDYFFNISVDQRNLYDVKWMQILASTDVAFQAQISLVFIRTFFKI